MGKNSNLHTLNYIPMIRLFTLNIPFRSKEYLALVSLRQEADELHCLVRYIDRGLQHVLPGDVLTFNCSGELKLSGQLPDDLSKSLMQCTAMAVSAYLQLSKNQAA